MLEGHINGLKTALKGLPANRDYEVKVTLNLSLFRCMLFANYLRNFHPIVMKFGKHYFLVLRQLP